MTTTKPHINRSTAVRTTLVILITGLVAAAATAAPSAPTAGAVTQTTSTLSVLSSTITTVPRRSSYTWPIKPFDRQHPVRGFLDDPRIGRTGSTAFHFGIDISAPDGTPVYAVEGGKVYMDNKMAVAVVAPNGHSFGYWHIVPVVKSHQIVSRHQLLGHIGKGWEHVHFAERTGGVYVNPLRDGGLGPYVDHTAPQVTRVALHGSALVAAAYDTPDLVVPGDWTGLPLTPALIRWRVAGGTWHTAIDSRGTMRPRPDFAKVFTPTTRQNHKHEPGLYAYYLERDWKSRGPVNVQVAVSDTTGNTTTVTALVGAEV